jgi:hypothetical protein
VAGLFQAIADYHEGWLPKAEQQLVPGHDRPADYVAKVMSAGFEPIYSDQTDAIAAFGKDTDPEYVAPREVIKTPNGIEVDSQGLPWDGRIHASSRAFVADGTWRLRRNVDDDVVQAVKRELQITMGAPVTFPPLPDVLSAPSIIPPMMFDAPPLEVQVPPPPFVLSAVPSVPVANISHLTEVIAPPSAGAAQTASPSRETHSSALTFAKLMQLITMKFASKELDQAAIQAAVVSAGIPSLPMLASRPDLVNTVADALGLL